MHEFHLMRQVVALVTQQLAETSHSRTLTVRLRVSRRSHLFEHDRASVQTTFEMAARGTPVEGAQIELLPVEVDRRCLRCHQSAPPSSDADLCATCGAPLAATQDVPEVVVHEVVVAS